LIQLTLSQPEIELIGPSGAFTMTYATIVSQVSGNSNGRLWYASIVADVVGGVTSIGVIANGTLYGGDGTTDSIGAIVVTAVPSDYTL